MERDKKIERKGKRDRGYGWEDTGWTLTIKRENEESKKVEPWKWPSHSNGEGKQRHKGSFPRHGWIDLVEGKADTGGKKK